MELPAERSSKIGRLCVHSDSEGYSIPQKSLNKYLTSEHILRLRPLTHWMQFTLHLSTDVCLRLCACICICLCVFASVCVHLRLLMHVCIYVCVCACISVCMHPRAFSCVCASVCMDVSAWMCLHSSVFICIQHIKHLDMFRRKWISASGRIFCSKTFQDVLQLDIVLVLIFNVSLHRVVAQFTANCNKVLEVCVQRCPLPSF